MTEEEFNLDKFVMNYEIDEEKKDGHHSLYHVPEWAIETQGEEND